MSNTTLSCDVLFDYREKRGINNYRSPSSHPSVFIIDTGLLMRG